MSSARLKSPLKVATTTATLTATKKKKLRNRAPVLPGGSVSTLIATMLPRSRTLLITSLRRGSVPRASPQTSALSSSPFCKRTMTTAITKKSQKMQSKKSMTSRHFMRVVPLSVGMTLTSTTVRPVHAQQPRQNFRLRFSWTPLTAQLTAVPRPARSTSRTFSGLMTTANTTRSHRFTRRPFMTSRSLATLTVTCATLLLIPS